MSKASAINFLQKEGAPDKLIRHAHIVGEVGASLLDFFESFSIVLDRQFIETGIVLHDIGKILHKNELEEAGHCHERAGFEMLLEMGFSKRLSHVCISHASYNNPANSLEELIISLADKLWKGKRESKLELMITDKIAERLNKDRWDLFVELDKQFETIANDAHQRLEDSRH